MLIIKPLLNYVSSPYSYRIATKMLFVLGVNFALMGFFLLGLNITVTNARPSRQTSPVLSTMVEVTDTARIGDIIVYTFTVSHDPTLSNLAPITVTGLTDRFASPVKSFFAPITGDANTNQILEFPEMWVYTNSYLITPPPPRCTVAPWSEVYGQVGSGLSQTFTSTRDSVVYYQPAVKILTTVDGTRNNGTTVWVSDTIKYTYQVSLDSANSDTNPPAPVEILKNSNYVKHQIQGLDYAYTVSKINGNNDDLLEPNEEWFFTSNYSVSANSGPFITSYFTVTGKDSRDGYALCSSTITRIYMVENRSFLDVTKTGPAKAGIGETVTYQYTVRYNDAVSDGSPLQNIVLYDDIIGPITHRVNQIQGDVGTNRDDNVLERGESWVYEGTYVIKLNDPKILTNTIVVSGTRVDGKVVTDTDFHVISVGFNPYRPKLEITEIGPSAANFGDRVTYTLAVKHAPFSSDSDQSEVSNLIVTDNVAQVLPGYSGDTNGDGKLNSNEIWTFTATYQATAPKEFSPVQSVATVIGKDKDGDDIMANTSHILTIVYKLVLTMTSYSSPASTQVGKIITYYYIVQHDSSQSDGSAISNTDIIALSDSTGGIVRFSSGDTNHNGQLETTETWVYAITYTVKATDATPLNIMGTLRYRQNGTEKIVNSSHQVMVAYSAYLELVKAGPSRANVGDLVVYTFTVRHSSISDGSPISTVVITDYFTSPDMVSGQAVPGPIVLLSKLGDNDTLLESGEVWTYTTSFTVTKNHAGLLIGKAEVTGQDLTGRLVDAAANLSTQVGGDGQFRPVLKVNLVGTPQVMLRGTVIYTFTVTHHQVSDRTPIRNITLSHDLQTPTQLVTIINSNGDTELDSNEIWVYTASYTISADNFSGYLDNQAMVRGTDLEGDAITFLSDVFRVKIIYQPVLTMYIRPVTTPTVGNNFIYNLKIEHAPNSDGSPVNGIVVTDSLHHEPIACTDDDGKLNQGEYWVCTGIYEVTSHDLEPLVMTAMVKGETINQSSVFTTTMATIPDIDYNPTLRLDLSAPTIIRNGDTMVYSFTVKHDNSKRDTSSIGNLTLTDILTISDKTVTHIPINYMGGDINQNLQLDSGEQWIYAATYEVNFAQPVPIWMELQATIVGVDLDGTPLQATNQAATVINPYRPLLKLQVETPSSVTIGSTPVLTLSVSHASGSDGSEVGVIFEGLRAPWYFVASVLNQTNRSGNLMFTETHIYTTTYPITLNDTDGVTLTIIATGIDKAGFELLDDAKFTNTKFIRVEHTPLLGLDRISPATAKIGDRITSTFMIYHDTRPTRKSDGSSVKALDVVDDVAGQATFVSGDINGNGWLDQGEIWTYQATYVVPSVTGGEFRSKSTVVWQDKEGDVNSYTTSDPTIQVTGLSLIQIAPPKVKIGDTIPYEFRLTYIGNGSEDLPIKNVMPVQNSLVGSCLPSGGDGDSLLEINETWSCKVYYTIPETMTQLAVNNVFSNVSTITATSNKGETLMATDIGSTEFCLNGCDLADLVSIYGDNEVNVGDTIFYSYFVRGFNDAVITSLGLTSSLSISPPRYIGGDDNNNKQLEAGETWTYFNLYPVTSTELMTVVNTVVVTVIARTNNNITRTAIATLSYTTRITGGNLPKVAKVYLPMFVKQIFNPSAPTPTFTPVPKTVLKVVSQRNQPSVAIRGQPVVFFIDISHDTSSNTPPDSFAVKADLIPGTAPQPILGAIDKNVGDNNDNGRLDIGEKWQYQFTYDTTCDTPDPLVSNVKVTWDLKGVKGESAVHSHQVEVRSEYYEGFDNANRPWALGSLTRGTYSIANSQYKVEPNANSTAYSVSPLGQFNHPIVSVKAKWESVGNWYGLLFGIQRNGTDPELQTGTVSTYRFLVDSNNQKFSLQKFDFNTNPNAFQTIIDWTSNSSINKGTTLNNLQVSCKGTTVTLLVNGTVLQSVSGQCSGELGVTANGNNTSVLFDNFEVCAPASLRTSSFSSRGVVPNN